MPSAVDVSPPELTPNSLYILKKRYLIRNTRGRIIETPRELFCRVARLVASAEKLYTHPGNVAYWEGHFYNAMARLEFLPNSPTLLNADRLSGQLASCFMIPVPTSSDVFDALRAAVLVHQSGGGTGFCFSGVAPGNSSRQSPGPVALITSYSEALGVVKQGGIRRGCNIVVLDVRHPNIMDFIGAKDDPQALPNFYLSVGMTEEFMQTVMMGGTCKLIHPETGRVYGRQNARAIFDHLVTQTWKTGDPGIIFLDRIERGNPTPHLGQIAGVSGCGEQPLLPYESCNLGSINLSRMLMSTGKGGMTIDYDKLRDTVQLAVRFLDNVIDMNKFPLPQIEEVTRKTRKIGLGVMGFADMLIQLGIPYDSDEALKTAEEVMSFINREAHTTSEKLAEERGPFPAYPGSTHDKAGGVKIRNASLTTIAPTGTLSIIASCSSGIEPLFGLTYTRHILDGATLLEVNPYFDEIARSGGFYSEDIMQKLAGGIPLVDIGGVPDKYKRLFVTAHDIGVEWHVKMQAAFQRHTDNAVSKTVNFPKEATPEDVAKVYLLAYEEGLKGITIYRDGSRVGQPLTAGKTVARLLARYLDRLDG